MASDYKFMDAGKTISAPEPAGPQKSYRKVCIDLDQFPGLSADMGEIVDIHIRGPVTRLVHDEYCHEMEVEQREVAIPTHTHESVGPRNEADAALGKLRSMTGKSF